jgi:hypothetical protein
MDGDDVLNIGERSTVVRPESAWSAWPLPTGPTKATRDVMAKIKVDVTSGARHVQKSLGVIRG